MALPFDERVDALTIKRGPNACWPWQGFVYDGYPTICRHDLANVLCYRRRALWRYVWIREFGPLPKTVSLKRTECTEVCIGGDPCMHLLCMNPYHMTTRPRSAWYHQPSVKQDYCKKGHDLRVPANVMERSTGRICRVCRNEYMREYIREYRRKGK